MRTPTHIPDPPLHALAHHSFTNRYVCTPHRRSCSLMDTLLALSEQGHYEEVMTIFTSPIKKCPELIFLTAIKAKVCVRTTCTYTLVHPDSCISTIVSSCIESCIHNNYTSSKVSGVQYTVTVYYCQCMHVQCG